MAAHAADTREALRRIAEIAGRALDDGDYGGEGGDNDADVGDDVFSGGGEAAEYTPEAVCTPRMLPKRLLQKAADAAIQLNPVNAPVLAQVGAFGLSLPSDPLFLAVLTSKYWGPQPRRLTVSFMESTPADLRARIISHLNAWAKTSGISFVETHRDGRVRISRSGSGYWSYLGVDVLLIPRNRPTMNLQGFTMRTRESEYKRVVRHEAGHTLGFPHEHMRKALVDRIDRQKAYDYFLRTQGWDPHTVDQQVLTPLDERSIMGTPADQTSIMCYQLPGSITRDGQPILGGTDINATDYAFAGRIYPKPHRRAAALEQQAAPRVDEDEWPATEDVELDLRDLHAMLA